MSDSAMAAMRTQPVRVALLDAAVGAGSTRQATASAKS